jgi:hypothetical protein
MKTPGNAGGKKRFECKTHHQSSLESTQCRTNTCSHLSHRSHDLKNTASPLFLTTQCHLERLLDGDLKGDLDGDLEGDFLGDDFADLDPSLLNRRKMLPPVEEYSCVGET